MSEEIKSQPQTQPTEGIAHTETNFQLEDQALSPQPELPVAPDMLQDSLQSSESAQRESFLLRRLRQIHNGYEGMSTKQKDVLQLGAMALSTTIFPAIGIMDGGHHVQASEHFLQWEGLGGLYALTGAAAVKFHRIAKRNR